MAGPVFSLRKLSIDLKNHSHKKRKDTDSLEGSLVRVLFVAELKFLKILVPKVPQNSSNLHTECGEKSKELYSLCDQLLGALIYTPVSICF